MIIIKGDKGKSSIVQCLRDNMEDCMVFQYCKKIDYPLTCSDLIVPSDINADTIVNFIINNISERYKTIIFYTDMTEQEIQELKEKLEKHCSYMFNFIITCTLD